MMRKKRVDEASGQVVKLIDQILVTAYRKEASDIHVEPSIRDKGNRHPLPAGRRMPGIPPAPQLHGQRASVQAQR